MIKSKTVGLTKTVFLTVHNNSKTETLTPIAIRINGNEIFSKNVTNEIADSAKVKLIEGKNILELFAHGQIVRQDTITIDWSTMYELNIYYLDTNNHHYFNYSIDDFIID